MFTQKIVQKFTVILMLLSFVQSAWAGFAIDIKAPLENKIAYATNAGFDESSIVNINNYVEQEVKPVNIGQTVKITDSTSRVSISLRDSDVKQVLRMFAQKAGMNVVFHSSVEGKVTLDLSNVTLNDAFLLVLRSAELTYVVDDKNIIVASSEKAKELSFGKQSMEIIPIKYEKASTVADFLNANLFSSNVTGLSNTNIVVANPATNEIMVFGTTSDADAAKKVVEKIDRKPMINTFKIKHTTPKQLAKIICNTFVETEKEITTDDEEDEEDDEDDEDEGVKKINLKSGVVACRASITSDSASKGGSGGGATSLSSSGALTGSVSTFASAPLTVSYFDDLGTINVSGGSYYQAQMIKEFIEQNDKKQPMAFVEVSVIELNEDGQKQFNNTWGLQSPFFNLNFNGTDGMSTTSPMPFHGGKIYNGPSTLTLDLNYLVTNGKGRILTNPKLLVSNGQKSIIDLTSDYIKSVKTEMTQSTTTTVTSTPIVTRTYEIGDDEGLKIEMVPFISDEGYVSMNIVPQFSTIKDQVKALMQGSTKEEVAATLLQRRDLNLKNVRIKDGETLVIAGLIKESEDQTISKVPILGDLPLIGVFFRSTSNTKVKEELVIMITPHIVYSEEDIAKIKTSDL